MGFTPNTEFTMFEIPVKHGAKMECVTVQEAEAGVRYPEDAVNYSFNSGQKRSCSCRSEQEE